MSAPAGNPMLHMVSAVQHPHVSDPRVGARLEPQSIEALHVKVTVVLGCMLGRGDVVICVSVWRVQPAAGLLPAPPPHPLTKQVDNCEVLPAAVLHVLREGIHPRLPRSAQVIGQRTVQLHPARAHCSHPGGKANALPTVRACSAAAAAAGEEAAVRAGSRVRCGPGFQDGQYSRTATFLMVAQWDSLDALSTALLA